MTRWRAAVALGANLGDRQDTLERAVSEVDTLDGTRLLACSSWIETEPVGGPPQGRFLNGAALFETSLDPARMLSALQGIERAHGRVRALRNGPRTLDLDLLYHGDTVCEAPGLSLPHPRLHRRAFVLEPLVQVDPRWVHPRLGRSASELLAQVRARTATAG